MISALNCVSNRAHWRRFKKERNILLLPTLNFGTPRLAVPLTSSQRAAIHAKRITIMALKGRKDAKFKRTKVTS